MPKDIDFNHKKLSEDDLLSWTNYTKMVKPLHGKKTSLIPTKKVTVMKPSGPTLTSSESHAPQKSRHVTPLQRQQLKNINIHGRLDLHGLTQQQAYNQLSKFILTAQNTGKKCVLIITGKGLLKGESWWDEGGVLKNMVPRWLEEEPLRSKITTYGTAKPEHGGAGALYVFIKKKSNSAHYYFPES